MKLDELLLKKEELLIRDFGGMTLFVTVPIHPLLLNDDIKINKDLAFDVFPKAMDEYKIELEISMKPESFKDTTNISYLSNGFANRLFIDSRRGLFLPKSASPREPLLIYPSKFINLPKEKAYAYCCDKKHYQETKGKSIRGFIYEQQGIDREDIAILLKSWAMFYINEALKEVFKNYID